MTQPPQSDLVFAGSIPELYERYMVPLIFQPYADDLAERVVAGPARSVLEVAAGTGVVTRALSAELGPSVAITATDLNQAMVDFAAGLGTPQPVTWQQADAQSLPFPDGEFDVVVCQFGAMFFPDRPVAWQEFRRVLAPGGRLLFNVWDRIEDNELADVITQSLAVMFPDDPPTFLARTPHGHHDPTPFLAELADAGFVDVQVDVVEARSHAASALDTAIAYCQGTPLRNEIVARTGGDLAGATKTAEAAVARRFGAADIDTKIQAFVVTATRP